jgi:WD40 repeat protein
VQPTFSTLKKFMWYMLSFMFLDYETLCLTSCSWTMKHLLQIFVWSMKTGRLLDILSGHEGPVHGLMFSPISVRDPALLILSKYFITNCPHSFRLFTVSSAPYVH